MGFELLFLLLPVAALTGWLIGRFSKRGGGRGSSDCEGVSGDYFKGLNYLLNEEPDRAIDIFVQMIEVDSETVETHLALANLFRKRGEVERAIRIHQNLIARPTLSKSQRARALFELGVDYLRAGLYDRAESLFIEVVDDSEIAEKALHHLLSIYEQEKEWAKAISTAERLKRLTRSSECDHVIAHYYCELALEKYRGSESEALKLLKRALASDKRCVRATLIEGEWAAARGDFKQAIKLLRRIEQQNPRYYGEAVPLLISSYDHAGRQDEILRELERVQGLSGDNEYLQLGYVRMLMEERGYQAAEGYLRQMLAKQPTLSAIHCLLELAVKHDRAGDTLKLATELLSNFVRLYPHYQCSQCGYTSTSHDWRCPSCRSWDTLAPNS